MTVIHVRRAAVFQTQREKLCNAVNYRMWNGELDSEIYYGFPNEASEDYSKVALWRQNEETGERYGFHIVKAADLLSGIPERVLNGASDFI